METIGQAALWSFLDGSRKIQSTTNNKIRADAGFFVESYLDLATKVAELQFRNRDYVMLFRGQEQDYFNMKGNTSLKPTLFRPHTNDEGRFSWSELINRRFDCLKEAEKELVSSFANGIEAGTQYLKRYRILRWALLQHYEVCKTPLLDVTHSLRIAASFAAIASEEKAFLFVLGVPNLSGAVTASAEGGLQIIRLSSVCPPSAVRPHIQEGYLLGEYPEMTDFNQKQHYESHEIDFGRRLIAKFWFNPKTFWKKDTFPMVSKRALYPDASDPIYELTQQVKNAIARRY
jgi:hypothetical protein